MLLTESACSTYRRNCSSVELPWGVSVNQDLYEELIRSGNFKKAYHVAEFPNSGALSLGRQDTSLLEDLIGRPEVPALQRAHLLKWRADLHLKANEFDQCENLRKQVSEIFEREGHKSGVLRLELNKITEPIKQTYTREESKKKIVSIKKELEELGDWYTVKDAMLHLSQLAVETDDDELLQQLDDEYEHIRHDCMSTLDWWSKELILIMYWGYRGKYQGNQLREFEEIYHKFATNSFKALAASAAIFISKIYETLGNEDESEKWMSKVLSSESINEAAGPGFFCVTSPFLHRLKIANSRQTSLHEEKRLLREFLSDIETRLKTRPPAFESEQVSLAIQHAHGCYQEQLANEPRRPFSEVKALTNMCEESAERIIPVLPEENRASFSAALAQKRGAMLWMEACQETPTNIELISAATKHYQEALEIHLDKGNQDTLGEVYSCIGQCNMTIFLHSTSKPDTPLRTEEFYEAEKYLRLAEATAANANPLPARQLKVNLLQSLWLCGIIHGLEPKGESIPQNWSARQECAKWLELAKDLLDQERRELSTIGTQQAVTAKQAVRRSIHAESLFKNAIRYSFLTNDLPTLWRWVQEAKARSISDLLALGINIPQTLRHCIDEHERASILFKEEIQLLAQTSSKTGSARITSLLRLDTLRSQMKCVPQLANLLSLREGWPIPLEKLREMNNNLNAADMTDRRVFFVDYFTFNGTLHALVVTPEDISYWSWKIETQALQSWALHWLSPEEPESLSDDECGDDELISGLNKLNTDDMTPLQLLSGLVEPLVQSSKPGDILVICPTEGLHSLPLHAATIDDDSSVSLIERNPVVYTPSLTVLDQCISRNTADSYSQNRACHKSIVGVFEYPEPVRQMAEYIQLHLDASTSVYVEDNISKPKFKEICEESSELLFFGHCNPGKSNILEQNLRLHDPVDKSEWDPSLSNTYTVSDFFVTDLKASLVTLIACGSASQAIQAGDEPLGLVAALLCAGANSVIGTMWNVNAGAGKVFAEKFYRNLSKAERPTGGASGLVNLAIVMQETIKEMKTGMDAGIGSEIVHWAPFVLHGSWLKGHTAERP